MPTLKKDTPGYHRAQHQMATDIAMLQDRAFRLGLFRTGHALHEATRAVGWELAEIIKDRRKKSAA